MTIPEEAKVSLYQSHQEDLSILERFEVDEQFLLEYPAWKRIEHIQAAELIAYDNSQLSWSLFKQAYYQHNPGQQKPAFWRRLLGV